MTCPTENHINDISVSITTTWQSSRFSYTLRFSKAIEKSRKSKRFQISQECSLQEDLNILAKTYFISSFCCLFFSFFPLLSFYLIFPSFSNLAYFFRCLAWTFIVVSEDNIVQNSLVINFCVEIWKIISCFRVQNYQNQLFFPYFPFFFTIVGLWWSFKTFAEYLVL